MHSDEELASSDEVTMFVTDDEREGAPPKASEQGEAPVRVGRYVVLERIGKGGMGTVYSAFDPELERRVAVKLMDASLRQDRLRREAQAIAQVAHPNVISVHDVGYYEHEGALGLYMVMALVEGVELDQWLSAQPRSWQAIVEIFAQIGRGLAAAHAQGVIHRDFKPGNVLVDAEDCAQVLDFGLARGIEAEDAKQTLDEADTSASGSASILVRGENPDRSASSSGSLSSMSSGSLSGMSSGSLSASMSQTRVPSSLSTELTLHGTVMGTPRYMSPEQHSTHAVDARSDQYSFCLALYIALYGEAPFAKQEREGLRALTLAKRQGVQQWEGGEFPDHLRALLQRGLAPRPEDRWPDMQTLVEALVHDPSAQRRRRRVALASLLGLSVLVGGALAWDARAQASCMRQDAWVAEAWGPTQREAVREAYAGIERGFASAALSGAEAKLDDYASALGEARAQLCLGEYRSELDAAAHAARSTCLDERREALSAVVERLSQADADAAARTVDVLATLPQLDTCAQLEEAVAHEGDPEQRRAIERDLFAAQLSIAAGRQREALEAIAPIIERARELGDPRTLALVTIRAADIYGAARDSESAEPLANEGTLIAERIGDHALSIDGLASLAKLLSDRRGRWDDAQRSLDLARAKYERAPGGRRGEWYFHYIQAAIHMQYRRFDESVEHKQKALESLPPSATAMDRAKVLQALAVSEQIAGDEDSAARHVQESIEIRLQVYGEDHPNLMYPYRTRARLLAGTGDHEGALELLGRVVELGDRHLGPESPGMLEPHMERAKHLRALQRFEQADAAYAKAQLTCAGADQSCGDVLRLRSQVALRLGQAERALEFVDQALAEEREHLGPDEQFPWLRARFVMHRAEALLALGRASAALAEFRRAADMRMEEKRDALLIRIWVGEGESLLELGEREAAAEAFARAQAHREEGHEDSDEVLGRQRWGEAKLAPDDAQRTQAAQQAIEAFEDAGQTQLVAAVEAWLEQGE